MSHRPVKRSAGAFWLPCSAVAALLAVAGASGLVAAPAKMDFTKDELEAIRGVVIQYLQEKKPEAWENFLVELKRGAIFLEKEYTGVGPSIGLWR